MKPLEKEYRYKMVREVPEFESRYYAQRFIDEQLPKEENREYRVVRKLGYEEDTFVIQCIGLLKIKQNKDFV